MISTKTNIHILTFTYLTEGGRGCQLCVITFAKYREIPTMRTAIYPAEGRQNMIENIAVSILLILGTPARSMI